MNLKIVQDISENLHSFEGFIYDLNIYAGDFGINDFINEIGCTMSNKYHLHEVGTMTDFLDAVRKTDKPGLTIHKGVSKMMCHKECVRPSMEGEKLSRSLNCRAQYARYDLNIQNCSRHCHRIPATVRRIDKCLNCIVYQWSCPVVEHMVQHIRTLEPSLRSETLVEWLMLRRDFLQKELDSKDLSSKSNSSRLSPVQQIGETWLVQNIAGSYLIVRNNEFGKSCGRKLSLFHPQT